MIHAELNHNPYLLRTEVTFNGQAPHINCQIEKYENQSLRDWANRVPSIFYDEMNGYDFDLDFIGTVSDFEEIKAAFSRAHVTNEMVRLFHRNELEGAEAKSIEIDALLSWLENTPNRKFDAKAFRIEHNELFDSSYPMFIIGDTVLPQIHPQIAPESVMDTNELKNTILTDTPILFVIREDNRAQIRRDLVTLLSRADVHAKQLFFLIDPHLNREQVKRVITDLGVAVPQIVTAYSDTAILHYFSNYPMTVYIRQAIQAFEEVAQQLTDILDRENQESELQNKDIHDRIDSIEATIGNLKEANTYFIERDNFSIPQAFLDAQNHLCSQIIQWRNRKTKVVGDAEIEAAAEEFNREIFRFREEFLSSVKAIFSKTLLELRLKFKNRYMVPGVDTSFDPMIVSTAPVLPTDFQPYMDALLALKKVTYEDPKPDLMAVFRKNAPKEEKVRVATCYYEEWREYALACITKETESVIVGCTEQLRQFYDTLAEAFHLHLEELISQKEQEKDTVSAQLSDEERRLQEDNDWLRAFKDQLEHIERG